MIKKKTLIALFLDTFSLNFYGLKPTILHTIILANLLENKKVDSDQAHTALLYLVQHNNNNSGEELVFLNLLVKLGAPINKAYADGQTFLHKVTEKATFAK